MLVNWNYISKNYFSKTKVPLVNMVEICHSSGSLWCGLGSFEFIYSAIVGEPYLSLRTAVSFISRVFLQVDIIASGNSLRNFKS